MSSSAKIKSLFNCFDKPFADLGLPDVNYDIRQVN